MSLPTLYEYYTSGGINSGLSSSQPYFTLNNKNITIFSGAMHYFRVPQKYWKDRLRKMRAAGLNAVETYVPWNLHESQPGLYDFGNGGTDFEHLLNIEIFLRTAQEEDLFAIVRPGPYICAEWEFGGLPSWLLRKYNIQLRSSNPIFMSFVAKYFQSLFSILTILQFTSGGPIIAFQIENEFGSLKRKDKHYLEGLVNILKHNGVVELLFTSDGPSVAKYGILAGVLATGNFQIDPENELRTLQSYQPGKPLMVMEYWTGWFDHWAEVHNCVHYSNFAYTLEKILKFPASVNLYMFHGGTSFGFMNGANIIGSGIDNQGFQPDTTSYDYDAPLSEIGDYTEKYYSAQMLIRKYNMIITYIPPMPNLIERTAYNSIDIVEQLTLDEIMIQVPRKILSTHLLPMELLPINNNAGQSYGYIIYRKTNLYIPRNSILKINGRICDTLMVLINGELKSKTLESTNDLLKFGYWKSKDSTLTLDTEYMNATMDLVVENWGRSNFGKLKQFAQFKGLWQGNVTINNLNIIDWEIFPLEFKTYWNNNLKNWHGPMETNGPALYKAVLHIDSNPLDTFIDMRSWNKGIIIVNGFVLSRYLKLGPQQASYLPGPFLKRGCNIILVFEHFDCPDLIRFSDKQLFQNIETKDDIYTKTISIYVEDYE